MFGWSLVLNQMELATISGRAHLLLVLRCFSEYRTYLVVVAVPKSQVIHTDLKDPPDHRDSLLGKANASTSKIVALGKTNYRPKIFYKESKNSAAVVALMSSW